LLKRFDMPVEENGSQVTIRGLAVSRSGKEFLITASSSVILCDDSGQVLRRYSTKGNVSRLLFLSSTRWALACGDVFGSPLYFLNLEDGTVVMENEHRWDTVSLDISPDDKWAVTGGRSRFAADRNYYLRTSNDEGGEVILWDVAAKKAVAKVHPCVDTVSAVTVSADGSRVAVAEEGDTTGQIIIFEIKEH
jgi:WD40 repeat protein